MKTNAFNMFLYYCYKMHRTVYYLYYAGYGMALFLVSLWHAATIGSTTLWIISIALFALPLIEMIVRSRKYRTANTHEYYYAWTRFEHDKGLKYVLLSFLGATSVMLILDTIALESRYFSKLHYLSLLLIALCNVLFLFIGSKRVSKIYKEKFMQGNEDEQ